METGEKNLETINFLNKSISVPIIKKLVKFGNKNKNLI